MVLGDINRVRRLAGNPSTTNVSDADITQGLTYGTAQVIRVTGKSDWETDTLNPDYASAVMAAEYFADSMIRDRFNDQLDISTEHYNRANDIIKQVAANIQNNPITPVIEIATGKYRSNPLNVNVKPYRSMNQSGQELTGVDYYYYYNNILF
jgi:hypothetical protein